MRVLAIDTSTLVLSVAVVDESRVLGEWTTNLNRNHSVSLMDGISQLMDELNILPEQVDAIAVAKGPGSYTGVRIGVATAKSLAWSLTIPAVGVSSLAAVAANAISFSGLIVPLFDARRGQVYTGCYRSPDLHNLDSVLDERIILLTDWLPLVMEVAGEQPILFLGEDLSLHRETITQVAGEQAHFAPPALQHPRAAHVGWLGIKQLTESEGMNNDPHELIPEYLQVSEAEAKWLANQQK